MPLDFSSIQEALDNSFENDTILVTGGTYYENLIWPNVSELSLIGEAQESTIINGNDDASVIFISNDQNDLNMLKNTITKIDEMILRLISLSGDRTYKIIFLIDGRWKKTVKSEK